MEIYLVRHTEPNIAKGICYGQADPDVVSSFKEEAAQIIKQLPGNIKGVYSSPLTRCRKLAEFLFADKPIQYLDSLKEINCGEWEMKRWNDIDPEKLDYWMKNYLHEPYPGGENFQQFSMRVNEAFNNIVSAGAFPSAVFTHSGVMRCILSIVNGTDIRAQLAVPLPYGTVIRLPVS